MWGFWWMAHQVEHLGNPWFTRSIAAPAGAQLGYHALMPLEGVVMMPVTVAVRPQRLLQPAVDPHARAVCYAMYRVARLWLPTQAGAIAAGAFFGLSSMLAWHAWYQLNLAAGVLFLPLALEAAVRLRRRPGRRQAVILGLVLGASLLTDQESAVLVGILVLLVLVPWLAARPRRVRAGDPRAAARRPGRKLAVTAAAVAVALVVASPQIAAMVAQTRSGGAYHPGRRGGHGLRVLRHRLPRMFGVSPRAVRPGPDRAETDQLPRRPILRRDAHVRPGAVRAGGVRPGASPGGGAAPGCSRCCGSAAPRWRWDRR